MICIARHIKAYHRQCFDREIADFGEPCSDCEFCKTCKFDWFARMKPLFENTNITIQLGRQGHFETLEKRVDDLEKQVQDQSLEKVAIELENWVKQFVGLTFHTPESPQQKL